MTNQKSGNKLVSKNMESSDRYLDVANTSSIRHLPRNLKFDYDDFAFVQNHSILSRSREMCQILFYYVNPQNLMSRRNSRSDETLQGYIDSPNLSCCNMEFSFWKNIPLGFFEIFCESNFCDFVKTIVF